MSLPLILPPEIMVKTSIVGELGLKISTEDWKKEQQADQSIGWIMKLLQENKLSGYKPLIIVILSSLESTLNFEGIWC